MENNNKKNLFWILSGVTVFVLLVAWVVGWWMINDSTAQQIQAREQVYGSVTGLRESTIPNAAISDVLNKRKEELTDIVYKIWEDRHQAQLSHFQRVLTDKSKDAIEIINKDPEEVTAFETDKFEAILANELARLDDVVNLRKKIQPAGTAPQQQGTNNRPRSGNTGGGGDTPSVETLGGGGGAGGSSQSLGDDGDSGSDQTSSAAGRGRGGRGASGPMSQAPKEEVKRTEYEGVVDWVDRDKVLGIYLQWEDKPTQAQVVYALEYWAAMYSVLDVIRQTNGDATHFEAPIKQIRALRIGRLGPRMDGAPPPDDSQTTQQPSGGANSGAPSLAEMGGGGGGNASTASLGDEGGGDSRGRGRGDADPAYHVIRNSWGLNGFELPDVNPQPGDKLLLEQFRYVDDNGWPVYTPQGNPHVEFRMIPMYLELVINQNEIDKFFKMAANSPLPIEVQQICAIHAIPPEEKSGNGAVDFGPQDVVLKVRGVIYKYQEPKRENLGKKPSEIVASPDAANP